MRSPILRGLFDAPGRIRTSGPWIRWAGLCPGNNESAASDAPPRRVRARDRCRRRSRKGRRRPRAATAPTKATVATAHSILVTPTASSSAASPTTTSTTSTSGSGPGAGRRYRRRLVRQLERLRQSSHPRATHRGRLTPGAFSTAVGFPRRFRAVPLRSPSHLGFQTDSW
jgi:hypothetical protein